MRLDPSYLHFISKEQLRVLSAIQIGMRNHQIVPTELIIRIANLRGGEGYKTLRKLLKNKLVNHTGKNYDGYKLTYLGYDYLALKTFMKRGLVKDVIMKIGVGKQSDVYKCVTPEGQEVVLKLTRLGRNSFRTIKNNRQYIQNRTSYSWLYLSKLSSLRQFTFMQVLYKNGFPVPKPIDTNRHGILMELIDAYPLSHVRQIGKEISDAFDFTLKLLAKLASYGLVHGDFNEFNLLINDDAKITLIDFPQCISINHPNASHYFNRDVECLYIFFDKLARKSDDIGDFRVENYNMPALENIEVIKRLDHEAKLLGHFTLAEEKQLQNCYIEVREAKKQQISAQQLDDEQQQQQQSQEQNQEYNQQDNENEQKKQKKKEQMFQCDIEIIESNQNQQIRKQSIEEHTKELELMMEEYKIQQKEGQVAQESQEEDPKYKGLTNYQIRQIIKQQKRIQREKKKSEIPITDYIKNALRKPNQRIKNPRGNYGKKNKNKININSIKQGFF